MRIVALTAFASVAAATACSQSTMPGPGMACPALAIAAPQLLYPVPGVSGVPTAAGSLVVAGSVPGSVVVDLAPQNGTTVNLGTPGAPPSPLPSPEATPANPDAPLHGVAYPALASGTTYTVMFHDTAHGCPLRVSGTASFTTR